MPKTSRIAAAALLIAVISLPAARSVAPAGTGPVANGALPGPFPLLPATNWWNLDITSAPVDPGSASYIAYINNGGTRRLHPDFGGDVSPGSVEIYGMPYASWTARSRRNRSSLPTPTRATA